MEKYPSERCHALLSNRKIGLDTSYLTGLAQKARSVLRIVWI